MPPVATRTGRLTAYLALWAAAGALLALLLAVQQGMTWSAALLIALPLAGLYAFVCLSSWYVASGMPLGATGIVRMFASAVTAAALASAGWVLAGRVWTGWLVAHGWIPPMSRGLRGLDALLSSVGVLIYLLALAMSYLFSSLERTRDIERRALEGQVLAREAELRLLRAQIDPHFLFNALHSISALTTLDPAAARRMCILLSDFLRESLALGTADRITLAREAGLVERYLAVERVRYGDRLRVAIAVPADAGACLVPPLLLQPLVENAVTHGVAHLLDGGELRLSATRLGDRLRVTVENPCDAERPKRTGTGVGIANVRARLAALHGEDAHLSAREEDGRWIVDLSMPATAAA